MEHPSRLSEGPRTDQDAQTVLAALAYLFPLSPLVWVYERFAPTYFLRYHATQAFLVHAFSVLLFFLPIAMAEIVPQRPLSLWPLGLQMLLGLAISLVVLLLFVVHLYCMARAYQGQYTVLPVITGWTYAWLERRGG